MKKQNTNRNTKATVSNLVGNHVPYTNRRSTDVAPNSIRRLPVIIVLDLSGSMESYETMLKTAIRQLYDSILKNTIAANSVELAIVGFNSEIEVIQEMCEIAKQTARGEDIDIHCEGFTLTGLALKQSLKHLDERIALYKQQVPRVNYYSPILFFLSDGCPEFHSIDPILQHEIRKKDKEALDESLAIIKERVAAKKLVSISMEFGNYCNHELMRSITGLDNDNHVITVDNTDSMLSYLFRETTSIIIRASQTGTRSMNEEPLRDMMAKKQST